jgi:hypothetical protein
VVKCGGDLYRSNWRYQIPGVLEVLNIRAGRIDLLSLFLTTVAQCTQLIIRQFVPSDPNL